MNLLGILIINWNSGDLLLKVLRSLSDSSFDRSKYHVYIVDNGSDDNSLSLIKGLDLNITIIQNKVNLGFGVACNIVLKNYPSEYILFLNPDVQLFPESLEKAMEFIILNPSIDILGVLNYDLNGKVAKSCARLPTTLRLINDALGLSKIAPKVFKPGTTMTDWDHLNSCEVDHVIAAFMLCRYQILKKVGFFDEDFFLYLEDLDLTKRIKDSGGKIFYNSEISIIHEGGGTSKKIKGKRLFYSLSSRVIYCRKHLNRFSTAVLVIVSISIEPFLRICQLIFSLKFAEIRTVIMAYWDYDKWLFKSLFK
jgi:GT2 family glycosyltransferase